MMILKKLNDFELEVLANLPVEPNGLSLPELADGLLARRDPQARSRIRAALDAIVDALGGIYAAIGDDDFDNCGIMLYGIRRADMSNVRRFLAFKNPYA